MIRAARRGLRFSFLTVAWSVGTVVAVTLIALAAGAGLGFRSFTVLSGSMEPALGTGDVVITERISPLDARIGDVVVFKDPQGSTKLITHRVRRIRSGEQDVSFTTRGDANNTPERWSVAQDGKIGHVLLRVPKLGYALANVRKPQGLVLLVVLPAFLLAVFELVRIWRPRRPEEAGEVAPAGEPVEAAPAESSESWEVVVPPRVALHPRFANAVLEPVVARAGEPVAALAARPIAADLAAARPATAAAPAARSPATADASVPRPAAVTAPSARTQKPARYAFPRHLPPLPATRGPARAPAMQSAQPLEKTPGAQRQREQATLFVVSALLLGGLRLWRPRKGRSVANASFLR